MEIATVWFPEALLPAAGLAQNSTLKGPAGLYCAEYGTTTC